MPQSQATDHGIRRERVPVGIFLPDPPRFRVSRHRERELTAWHHLQPWDLAHLVANYTEVGDVVVNADAHRTVSLATRYLNRHPATASKDPEGGRINAGPAGQRALRQQHGAKLVLATLPSPDVSGPSDPNWPLVALSGWRRLLRPGGFLVVAVPAQLEPLPANGSVRGSVIAAARTVGLVYQQHLLVVTHTLSGDEPAATADTAGAGRPKLRAGRHALVHRDLLAFATTTGREVRR